MSIVAQIPNSLATSLMGRWKYFVSCSNVMVVVAERSAVAMIKGVYV